MRRFGVLVLAGLVAACGSSTKETVLAPCPRVTILADGADVTRYQPGAPADLAAMVVDGRIAGVGVTCDYVRGGGVEVKVAAIISTTHREASTSRHRDGKKLQDFSDIVLDTGAPVGDAMVKIEGLETPVAPGSTVGGCLLVNAIKAEVADRLTKAGQPPKVLTAGAVVGTAKATELFEAAYDEHARRIAKYYAKLGV
jgi:uncharacterized phosphosugar-binding protein